MKNLHTTPAVALCGLRGRSRTLKAVVAVGLICWIIVALVFWRIRSMPSPAAVQQKQLTFSTDFQVVEEGSGFVYSAYIDDRPARDVSSKADSVVRIFVYFLRTIDVKRKWKCLLWLEGNDAATPAPIATVTDLNTLTKFRFMVAMVICDMPASQSHLVVKGVSLRSSDSRHNETTNFVDVIDLRRSTSRPLNRLSAEPTVATFTVCTSPIHGNYYNVSDIVNFIEVSRTLGAERFVFYFDWNLDPSIRSCLESYRDAGIVEMYAFSPPVLDGLHYHGQILSITECVYRTMYRTMYLLNQDIDEVLVPTKADDWPSMLDAIHRRIGRPAADRIASYSFQNQFFPLEAKDDPTFSDSFLVRRYDIKVLLKTEKESYVYPHGHRSKVMARPDRILIWHVHLILRENVIDRNDTIHLVSTKDALLHHYRSLPAKRGALLRDQRMLRNASLITDRVHSGRGRCLAIDSNAQT